MIAGYDAWKTATPPEYEQEEVEDIAPAAQPNRCPNCCSGFHDRCDKPWCSCLMTDDCGKPPKKEEPDVAF